MLTVTTVPATDTSDAVLKSCAGLMWATPEFEWAFDPAKGDSVKKTEENNINDARRDDCEEQTALQWHYITELETKTKVLACAKTFIRTIAYKSKEGGAFIKKRVLALGNVACHPSMRGKGYGKAVVLAGLARLDAYDDITHFLFETGIPPFYEKLGGKQIKKELIVNSTGDKVAFEDEFVMVLPAGVPWPEGEIDLLGPGY